MKAASAHGRMTAAVLTLLPVLTMLGLMFVAPELPQGHGRGPRRADHDRRRHVRAMLGHYSIRRIVNIKV